MFLDNDFMNKLISDDNSDNNLGKLTENFNDNNMKDYYMGKMYEQLERFNIMDDITSVIINE